MLKVTKFGGSSMADAGQYRKVRDIIMADPSRKVVVVSAAGKRFKEDHKLTDLLYLCHAHTQYGVDCTPIFDMITSRYLEIRDELELNLDLESEFEALKKRLDKKRVTQDELVSRGEYFSAKLMAAYLGYNFVDAADWVKFNMDGTVNTELSYDAFRDAAAGQGVVTPGFYGSMPGGHIKTFSRGGSDITGAYAAAALDADVYENWTDVSGILMADPRIVDDPMTIPQVTYDELRELSYSGAQVLHEGTIFPVREKGIPVNIRNTNAPDHPGTIIQEDFENTELVEDRFITGISGKKDFSIVHLSKRGLSNEVGLLRRILTIYERHNVSVVYVPNGIDSVSVVVETDNIEPVLYTILAEIQQEIQPDTLTVFDELAVVTAVGRHMAKTPGISGKLFGALGKAGINIRFITQSPDELNIIFGVENKDFKRSIQVLYDKFAK
ncbi:MAG: aspartate kinase [Oscillospiraceae bacterium]|nr:aspartate kinase [Oscillospiraceae bacterium]